MAIRRAAFDIGSGATKLQVADVANGRVLKTLFGEERPVPFNGDVLRSADGNISEEIMQLCVGLLDDSVLTSVMRVRGIDTLRSLKGVAVEQGSVAFSGVATEVHRVLIGRGLAHPVR